MSFKYRIFRAGSFLLSVLLTCSVHAQFTEFHPELEWYTIKGQHCVVHFHEGAERTAQTVAKIADEIWDPITNLYEFQPETVHFVIKDIDDYSNGATFFFDNKIEIWSSALDFELRGFHNWLRNVISHEFTHMVQIQAALKSKRTLPAVYLQWLNYEDERRPDILYGFPNVIVSYPFAMVNMPSWFAEGTAQYMRKEFTYDRWDAHRDMILRSYALDGNFLTWSQMGVFDKTSLGNESVYNSGFALTLYIAQKYGEDKLRLLTKALGNMKNFTFDAACKDVLGIPGKQLYEEWTGYLKTEYRKRLDPVLKNTQAGTKIFEQGFGNFYPLFHNGSDTVLFVSNKGSDYLSLSSVYMLDLKTKKSELVIPGVRSTISVFPNSRKLLYAKLSEDNPGWANVHDLYIWDMDKKEEKRLTKGLRANQPRLSPDGKLIAFTFQKDGTGNIGMVDTDSLKFTQITFYSNGEQVFNPVFSPDGATIVFDFAYSDGRDIASVNLKDPRVSFILNDNCDERNPVFDFAGNLIYSSDKTGIYNLYSKNLTTGVVKQLTNVTGGAFMPAVDQEGNIIYAGYTSAGYKLYYLSTADQKPIGDNSNYVSMKNPPLGVDVPNGDNKEKRIDRLAAYNDNNIEFKKKEKYSGAFTKMTFYPVIRFDNYNTSNNAFEKIKPGLYMTSTDMLNRYSFFGGASVNSRMERDIFFSFDYRNKLPGLYQLGIKPELTLELYSISRKSPVTVSIDEFPDAKTDAIYNLFEVDISAKHRIFARGNDIQFKYSFSRYSAALAMFVLKNDVNLFSVPEFSDVYLLAGNFEVKYTYKTDIPTIDSDINPEGVNLELKWNYELNRYNPDGQYNNEDGTLQPIYSHYNFNRFELKGQLAMKTFENQTATFNVRAGTILGPTVPDFFDFYLGGLIGMKSYPFYAISGNEVLWLNLTYRFPLWRQIDATLGHFYIDKMFLSVYGDFGNAWNGANPKIKEFKKGAGAELRLAMSSFYIFPTSVFFNASYGFDRFNREVKNKGNITYGKEMRYYAGVLFGFDF